MKLFFPVALGFCLLLSLNTQSMQKTVQPVAITTSHQSISLIEAFILGKLNAEANDIVRYPHYNNSRSHYNGSISESSNYIYELLHKLTLLKINMAVLPFEKRMAESCNTAHSVQAKTAKMLEMWRSLDDSEKEQLETYRLSDFMGNGDLAAAEATQEVKNAIKVNRENYKEALKSCIPNAINEAQKKKLHIKSETIEEYINSTIADIELNAKNIPIEHSDTVRIPQGCLNIM